MSEAEVLDKKIVNYLDQLNTKQKRAVLSVVKTFAEEQGGDMWEDENFIKELDRRTKELETGKVKGYSWEEVKSNARQQLKAQKKK